MLITTVRYQEIVHNKFAFCRDGRGRCGVYCAANACIEQVIQHGEVDIFQAVKAVRRHRPQLIENMVYHTIIDILSVKSGANFQFDSYACLLADGIQVLL